MKVQLIAIHSDGKTTVVNTTNDTEFLEKIIEARDGMVWIGSDLCDLCLQVIK